MAVFELSISEGYGDWKLYHGIRDLLQNHYDGVDERPDVPEGLHQVCFRKHQGAYALRIRTHGVRVTRDKLALGQTTKLGTRARGRFGEGMKLSWLALLRGGATLRVINDDEDWHVRIEHSTAYQCRVLTVETKRREPTGYFEVVIGNLGLEIWEQVQDACLLLRAPKNQIKVEGGAILLDPEHKGKLFVRDLFVTKLPDPAAWGYNLTEVELDRDRRLVDPWSLKTNLRNLLTGALQRGHLTRAQIYDLAASEEVTMEGQALGQIYAACEITTALKDEFVARHGDSVPVKSMGESAKAEQMGLRATQVTPQVANLLGYAGITTEKLLTERKTSPKKVYGFGDLTEDERAALLWSARIFQVEEADLLDKVRVVDFYDDTLLGTYVGANDTINVARRIAADRSELIATLIHEIAHRRGPDGSLQHRTEIERLAGKLLAQFP